MYNIVNSKENEKLLLDKSIGLPYMFNNITCNFLISTGPKYSRVFKTQLFKLSNHWVFMERSGPTNYTDFFNLIGLSETVVENNKELKQYMLNYIYLILNTLLYKLLK